jgi:hypothetical protein
MIDLGIQQQQVSLLPQNNTSYGNEPTRKNSIQEDNTAKTAYFVVFLFFFCVLPGPFAFYLHF